MPHSTEPSRDRERWSYAIALSLACSRLLYRAAVFFLMMPQRAERSISEKVAGSASFAAFASLCSSNRRMDRIW